MLKKFDSALSRYTPGQIWLCALFTFWFPTLLAFAIDYKLEQRMDDPLRRSMLGFPDSLGLPLTFFWLVALVLFVLSAVDIGRQFEPVPGVILALAILAGTTAITIVPWNILLLIYYLFVLELPH